MAVCCTSWSAVLRVHAEVSAVEQGVDIGSEQEPVVEPVLPAPGDRAAIVAPHQRCERGPRRLVESHHGVRGFGHEAQPNGGHRTSLFVPN